MDEEDVQMFAQGAAGLALAASALAEAARSLSEAAAALSTFSIASQDTEVPPTVHQSHDSTDQVSESHETDDEAQEFDDDDDSSVGANTGNNVYPRDVAPEGSTIGNEDSTPTRSHFELPYKSSDGKEPPSSDSVDQLIRPGHLYLVLAEEFDALPLILAYATAGKKTICYVPTSGSLSPWESIISSIIPSRQVWSAVSFSGNSIVQLSEIVEQFASADKGSVLTLRSTFNARANECKAHSRADSVIFWGLPGSKFWPDTMEAVQQSPHALLILSQRECVHSNCQSFLTGLGSSFAAHPNHRELNSLDPGSLLTDFRDNVQRIIPRAQHSQNIQAIYEALLESPINDTGYVRFIAPSSAKRIDIVNKFMARVFLRGAVGNGSSRYPPAGPELHIPDRTNRRLTVIFKAKAPAGTGVKPKAIPETTPNKEPVNVPGPLVFTPRPGRWWISLQRDADAIPFICYLANRHPRSMCCISHTDSAFVYGNLFNKISTHKVITTSKKPRTLEEGIERFSNAALGSRLCLVRGNPLETADNPLSFERVRANALIYWGLPAESSFLWPSKVSQGQFTHVYIIVPLDQISTTGKPIMADRGFQEHPDSAILNAEGDDSAMHPFRERVKSALASTTPGEYRQISQFYFPANPPAYPVTEFLKRAMLWNGY
ncbi:hypothetical protein RSOLAG22IIIB_09810 [Rhizoctonia solani]|uniref:Uncharacterized protein n=1 Tax=Rhizoctonia solani TaxID=456999 RepID=A0A0K6G059_9AGAM|nr:hypothetical protein RSOLAG22IIIB_09810 [Rhizoctonia solani]